MLIKSCLPVDLSFVQCLVFKYRRLCSLSDKVAAEKTLNFLCLLEFWWWWCNGLFVTCLCKHLLKLELVKRTSQALIISSTPKVFSITLILFYFINYYYLDLRDTTVFDVHTFMFSDRISVWSLRIMSLALTNSSVMVLTAVSLLDIKQSFSLIISLRRV